MAKLQHPLTALYYPDFEPDPGWLRAQLLFFDKVESIIPEDITWTPEELNDELVQKGLFQPIRKTAYLPDNYRVDWDTFDRACEIIKSDYGAANPRDEDFTIRKHSGDFGMDRRSWLHHSKLNLAIRDRLLAHGLVIEEKEFLDGVGMRGFHVADEAASSLVVGMVAEHIAGERGVRCVTQLSLPHYFNLCNGYQASARTEHEGALASFTIKFLVPPEIERMPLDKYLDIRDRHAGLRSIYRRFLKEACDEWDLSTITSPDALRSGVMDFAQQLSSAVEEERRKSGLMNVARDWGTTLVSAGCRFVSLASEPSTKLIAAGGMVAMQVLDKVTKRPDPGHFDRAVKMMATLKDDLNGRSKVQRLLGTGVPNTTKEGGH